MAYLVEVPDLEHPSVSEVQLTDVLVAGESGPIAVLLVPAV